MSGDMCFVQSKWSMLEEHREQTCMVNKETQRKISSPEIQLKSIIVAIEKERHHSLVKLRLQEKAFCAKYNLKRYTLKKDINRRVNLEEARKKKLENEKIKEATTKEDIHEKKLRFLASLKCLSSRHSELRNSQSAPPCGQRKSL